MFECNDDQSGGNIVNWNSGMNQWTLEGDAILQDTTIQCGSPRYCIIPLSR